jgi:hypothetical protein
MKCPKCQAKLLPVDGEMFCLQCGTAVMVRPTSSDNGPDIERTDDPLLQEAIVDAVKHPIHFRLPVNDAPPPKALSSFTTMRSALRPARSLSVAGTLTLPSPSMVVLPIESSVSLPQTSRSRTLPKPHREASFSVASARRIWLLALGVFAVFIGFNALLSTYYSARVFPGVRLNGSKVGGLSYDQLNARINDIKDKPNLVAVISSVKYPLDTENLATINRDQIEREVWNAGRTTPLPVAGVIETLLSKTITTQWQINNGVLNNLSNELVYSVNRAPADAVPVVYNGQVFVIAEKTGSELDPARVATAIRLTYGYGASFVMTPEPVDPKITSASYADYLADAQQILSLKLEIKFKTAVYNPTIQQLGQWMILEEPNNGISVNDQAVAAYITTIPGNFDRTGATNALISAIVTRQNLTYSPSISKLTPTPVLHSIVNKLPSATYTYCTSATSQAESEVLSDSVASTLTDSTGWSLGGRLRFAPVQNNCNLSIRLVRATQMSSLSATCSGQSTCRLGNQIELNLSNWMVPPTTWTQGTGSYRQQMIEHEIGHWLGFDHGSCTLKSSAVPILESPTVILNGCSPNWYQLSSVTSNKVLPGF